MAFTPVAVWGDPSTPFQLAGKSPIERRPTTDQLWEYANPHLGFYGFPPCKAVDDAIADEAADMGCKL